MRALIHSKARCCAKGKYEQPLAFTIHIPEAPCADPLKATRVLAKTAKIAASDPADGGHTRTCYWACPTSQLEAVSALECERANSASVASPVVSTVSAHPDLLELMLFYGAERWAEDLGFGPKIWIE
jgi:hypothetical protein